ncbi:MAG: DNA-processing protein DprA [Planctomycetes bacterium]|nr:DNA-processing protein DprA [Planctomycetota bacterium]
MTEQEDYQRLLNQLESPETHHPEDQDLQETLGKEVLKDQESYLRLALVDGVGCRTMRRLLSRFGSAKDVLKASLRDLGSVERVGPKTATAIRDNGQGSYADEVLKICKQQKIELLFPGDPRIPVLLTEISDPPLVLYLQGEFRPDDALAVGMVGTRHATAYGRYMAERLTRGLCGYGCTIVSGLARGIDGVCHRKALECGGRTIAVLGSSLTEIYPPEHADLASNIRNHGVLLSETPPLAKPKAGVFPQRNRIISGLSLGVVVVEAAERSGSLITARHAGEQGRDVFAVPGQASAPTSRGSNRLIRDGALLVQDAEDILEHLGPLSRSAKLTGGQIVQQPKELILNEIERGVLQAIDVMPTDIDLVVQRSQLAVSQVLSTLSVLELKGAIKRTGGRSYGRKYQI